MKSHPAWAGQLRAERAPQLPTGATGAAAAANPEPLVEISVLLSVNAGE